MTILKPLSLLAVAAIAVTMTGCAAISTGTSQVISVQTKTADASVVGAACELKNDKGDYFVTTPGFVTVHRAYGDMRIKCTKPGEPDALATVKSSTKAMALGNVLFGGVIGAGIDAGTGAAYDYPALVTLSFGQDITLKSTSAATSTKDAQQQDASNATQPAVAK